MSTSFKVDIYGNINQGQNATPFITREMSFCPNCNISQTNIQGRKKLSKEFEKEYVKLVFDCINKNDMKLFTKKDLMVKLNIVNLSNGVLQDQALSVLIMLGYLRRENQEYKDDKDKVKMRSIYIRNSTIKHPICYDYNKDEHIPFDWFNQGNRIRFGKRGEIDGTRA